MGLGVFVLKRQSSQYVSTTSVTILLALYLNGPLAKPYWDANQSCFP